MPKWQQHFRKYFISHTCFYKPFLLCRQQYLPCHKVMCRHCSGTAIRAAASINPTYGRTSQNVHCPVAILQQLKFGLLGCYANHSSKGYNSGVLPLLPIFGERQTPPRFQASQDCYDVFGRVATILHRGLHYAHLCLLTTRISYPQFHF